MNEQASKPANQPETSLAASIDAMENWVVGMEFRDPDGHLTKCGREVIAAAREVEGLRAAIDGCNEANAAISGLLEQTRRESDEAREKAAKLEEQNGLLWRDCAEWLQFAKRQHAEMENPGYNPLTPTASAINATERLLFGESDEPNRDDDYEERNPQPDPSEPDAPEGNDGGHSEDAVNPSYGSLSSTDAPDPGEGYEIIDTSVLLASKHKHETDFWDEDRCGWYPAGFAGEWVPGFVYRRRIVMAQPAEPTTQRREWCPDVCPITLAPFFMWLEHPDLGLVPTYGGPFESYTIPKPSTEESCKRIDREYIRYRYDHDLGGWLLDECEVVEFRVVTEECLLELGAWESSKPTPEEVAELRRERDDWEARAVAAEAFEGQAKKQRDALQARVDAAEEVARLMERWCDRATDVTELCTIRSGRAPTEKHVGIAVGLLKKKAAKLRGEG